MAIRNGRHPEMDEDMVRPIVKAIEVHKRTAWSCDPCDL